MISPHSINQLLQTVPIEDIVGDYVKLKRSGSRYKGNCPFHDEKTPSFTVTPSLNIYKCFGCQKGGNAIQFLMDMEQLTFVESARELAKRYGIELIETNTDNRDEAMQLQREKESLQALNEFALQFFEQQLHESEEGKTIALPYFRERGFTIETIKNWRLGYSPSDWTAFYDYAKKAGYSEELLQTAGLIKVRDKDQSYYDLFRNRVMFPLVAVSGKPVGFAGRIMGKADKAPKYVNSPETPLYKKSDFLFAVFQAKSAIRKDDKAYLMEGYTDVITLHQSGIENCVASSGTALTPGQIRLLKRFTDNATVIYDGDAAGIKASLRGINLLLEEGMNVRVVAMPEGQDPDSFCQELGPENFKLYLHEKEENFILFKAKLLFEESGKDPLKRSEALRDILESVAFINDILKRDALVKELERVCDTTASVLHAELAKILRKKQFETGNQIIREVQQFIEEQPLPATTYVLNDLSQEQALLYLLIKYGHKEIEEGVRVVDEIMGHYLEDPRLAFSNEETKYIMRDLVVLYESEEKWPEAQEWIQQENLALAELAATVLTEQHVLSPKFKQSMIDVKTEEDNLVQQIIDVFLNLNRTKIDQLILTEQERLKELDTLNEEELEIILQTLKQLTDFKLQIGKAIGAAVSRI